nr:uncharacterized protein LOC109185225 [Ipomoea batatas]
MQFNNFFINRGHMDKTRRSVIISPRRWGTKQVSKNAGKPPAAHHQLEKSTVPDSPSVNRLLIENPKLDHCPPHIHDQTPWSPAKRTRQSELGFHKGAVEQGAKSAESVAKDEPRLALPPVSLAMFGYQHLISCVVSTTEPKVIQVHSNPQRLIDFVIEDSQYVFV